MPMKIGDRVVMTAEGYRNRINGHDPAPCYGTVTGVGGRARGTVRVLKDGRKTSQTYGMRFWKVVDAQG